MTGAVTGISTGVALGLSASAAGLTAATAAGIGAAAAIGSGLMAGMSGDINIPEAKTPAVSASGVRADTGAQIKLGVTDVADSRISGSRGVRSTTSTSTDALAGLGRGGLAI